MAKRIQRKRTKGWRMPKGCRYVGRGTIFGNPFPAKRIGRAKALSLYRKFMRGRWGDLEKAGVSMMAVMQLQIVRAEVLKRLPELRGRDLSCWCPIILDNVYVPCHADVLLEIANA